MVGQHESGEGVTGAAGDAWSQRRPKECSQLTSQQTAFHTHRPARDWTVAVSSPSAPGTLFLQRLHKCLVLLLNSKLLYNKSLILFIFQPPGSNTVSQI